MKLTKKPWNDPWQRDAERDPKYKRHCTGGSHRAMRMSWRRINKAFKKIGNYPKFSGRLGRAERNIYVRTMDYAHERYMEG